MGDCEICDRRFSHVCSLRRHKKEVHKITPERLCRRRIKCPLCHLSVLKQKYLVSHLKIIHNIKIEEEELNFSSKEDFNKWKTEIEKETRSSYVKDCASYRLSGGELKSLFRCHRQGSYIDSVGEQRKRQIKRQGSNKMGSACPSYIEMTEDGNSIYVVYYKGHYGHNCTFRRLPLSKEDRIRIADLIESGVSLPHILTNIRENATEDNFSRLQLTNRRDLHNIRRQFSLGKERNHIIDESLVIKEHQGRDVLLDNESQQVSDSCHDSERPQMRDVLLDNESQQVSDSCHDSERPQMSDACLDREKIQDSDACLDRERKQVSDTCPDSEMHQVSDSTYVNINNTTTIVTQDMLNTAKHKAEVLLGYLATSTFQEQNVKAIIEHLDKCLYRCQKPQVEKNVSCLSEASNKNKNMQNKIHSTKQNKTNVNQKLSTQNASQPVRNRLAGEFVIYKSLVAHTGFDHTYGLPAPL